MDLSLDTVNQEVQVAGSLKYVQFTAHLNNFIETEILLDGWQSSADAFEKIIPKKKYLHSFNNAFHGAILTGFKDSLNEMLTSVDLPKQWDVLYQEKHVCNDEGKNFDNSKMSLINLKLKHKSAIQSVIELKQKKIEGLIRSLNICKLNVSKKISELEATKEKLRKNCDSLEELSSMRF